MKLAYAYGATPIDADQLEGLKPSHITNQQDLNEFEYINILKAERWAFSRKRKNFFSIDFILQLHKKMFDDTWKWSGTLRKTLTNIGVNPENIRSELTKLLEDVITQIKYNSLSHDEIAYRFHHRLVYIHPFLNGNGRHARLMTDLLLDQYLKQPKFTWQNRMLISDNFTRKKYIESLKAADKQDYSLLAKFVRS